MLVDLSKVRSFAETLKIVHACANSNAEIAEKISALQRVSTSARRQGNGSRPGVSQRQSSRTQDKKNNAVTSRPASNGDIVLDMRNIVLDESAPSKIPTQVSLPTGKALNMRLTDFKAPPKTQIAVYTATINKLHDNLNMLSEAIALMKQAFADNKKQPAAVKSAIALYNDATELSNDAYALLNGIAEKHLPTDVADIADAVEKQLLKTIPAKTYSDTSRQIYCAVKDEDFYFCNYFEFVELKNAKGFSYPAFYVVLTAVVNAKTKLLRLYVTSLTDFRPPLGFPPGVEVADLAGVKKRLAFVLSANDVSAYDKLPMVNHAGVEAIAGVGSKSIKDDVLTITYRSSVRTQAQKDEVLKAVLAVLGGGFRKKGTHFSYTTDARGFSVMLVPAHGSDKLSANKLLDIKQQLGLTDQQVEALKFALQH